MWQRNLCIWRRIWNCPLGIALCGSVPLYTRNIFRVLDVDKTGKRDGKKGGKPSRPSKFVPEKINHTGFVSDDLVKVKSFYHTEVRNNGVQHSSSVAHWLLVLEDHSLNPFGGDCRLDFIKILNRFVQCKIMLQKRIIHHVWFSTWSNDLIARHITNITNIENGT